MKKLMARIAGLAAAAALLLCGTGCWDVKELDDISLVTGIGVDSVISGGEYSVTVQTALPGSGITGSQEGQGQGGRQQKPYRLARETGKQDVVIRD